jgi:hypothetical protein
MDYFYEGIQRLDWGFGNPNKTAAFIAMLVVAVWSIGQIWNKLYWFGLIGSGVLCMYLLQTVSRGGLLAAIIGCGCACIVCKTKWNRYKVAGLIAGIVALWIYSVFFGVAERYTQGLTGEEDRSLSNRWLIYRAVPQMLVDAPGGWGEGNAPEAFQQWYQPEGRSEKYLNLVNSHFTWLVEWGTLMRLAYILGWIMVFIIIFPRENRKWWGGVLSVWLTFFIASTFSSVAHHPWMWPLPLALLTCVLLDRLWSRRGLSKRWSIAAPLMTVFCYGLLLSSSVFYSSKVALSKNDSDIIIEGKEAEQQYRVVIVGTDKKILGTTMGHRLRALVSENSGCKIYWTEDFTEKEFEYDYIVLVGEVATNPPLTECKKMIFLNPSELPKNITELECPIEVLWGEFHSSNYYYSWLAIASKQQNITFTKILGEGTYLETWQEHMQ